MADTLNDRAALVACLHLDGGRVYLSDSPPWATALAEIKHAILDAGTITLDGANLRVTAAALAGQWLASRRVVLWRCQRGTIPENGELLFDGISEGQPDQQDGILSLTLCRPLYDQAAATIPAYGTITATDWPNASDTAQGKVKPLIWGTVERCPLLPVSQGLQTRLRSPAYPGDSSLFVDDCTNWPVSGEVAVDGVVYDYAAHDDTTFYGVSVSRQHAAETAVYQPLPWVYLAAGHPITALTAVRAGDTVLSGGTVDLTAASVAFPAPPYRETVGEVSTLYAQFDRVNAASTALEGVNAIQAATGPAQTHSATNVPLSLTGATSKDTPITFPRPTAQGGTDTIIGASYEVRLTVASPCDCQVSIASKMAFVQSGGAVLYHPALLTWLSEDNTDQIPLSVTVPEGADAATVTLTIHSATRTVVVGNADAARYATLRAPSNRLLSVVQMDDMAPRGAMSRAQIAIEWASSDALLSTESLVVRWAGRTLGTLSRDRRGQSTQSMSFNFDLAQSGRAQLRNQDLRTLVSGGTTTLSYKPTQTRTAAVPSYGLSTPLSGWTTYAGVVVVKVPENAKVGAVITGLITYSPGGTVTAPVYVTTSDGQSYSLGTGSPGATRSFEAMVNAGTSWIKIYHGEFYSTDDYNRACRIIGLDLDWPINQIQESNTPASGSTTVQTPNLPLSGTLAASNTLTAPADEQTVISWFDLPEREWSDFTGKSAEIELISTRTSLSVMVARVLLTIEHAPISREPADPEDLTATISGLSGTPADVLATLADHAGVALSPFPLLRLARTLGDWRLARRLDSETEARGLLYELCDHLALERLEDRDGLTIVTSDDIASGPIEALYPRDMLDSPRLSWSALDSRTTDLTFRYRDIDGDTTRSLTLTPASCAVAALGRRQVGKTIAQEVECPWVADDTTAHAIAEALMVRDAPLFRTLSVTLTPRWASLSPGAVLAWDGSLWRLQTSERAGAGIAITAREIPRFS